MEQGIDHLVSLSPEKIPPHYAFPNLKHTLIPVEDFTGPTIAEIQKFIEITDEARREGEAVGVHCAEGEFFFTARVRNGGGGASVVILGACSVLHIRG